jgi:hypothetical protein
MFKRWECCHNTHSFTWQPVISSSAGSRKECRFITEACNSWQGHRTTLTDAKLKEGIVKNVTRSQVDKEMGEVKLETKFTY